MKGFYRDLRSKKWLLGCSYNPHWDNITPHLRKIGSALDKLSTDYENIILIVDLNVEVDEKILIQECSQLESLDKTKNLF